MIKLVYPATKPAIKLLDSEEYIFCIIRKRWLVITPEEWVRQNFLFYLIEACGYSKTLIAVEKKIKVGELDKRFDIVVYTNNIVPLLVVECKEMNVGLSPATLRQVLRYNIKLDATFLIITNGSYCYAFKKTGADFTEIFSIPKPG